MELSIATDDEIVSLILLHEGGIFTDHPNDAGGPTKWGITIPVLSAFLQRGCTADDIRTLPRETAAAIYIQFFIRPFDGLPDPIRVNAIDFGVNAGIKRSVIVLQQTIGVVVDGQIGQKTRRTAAQREWNTLYVGGRLAFYEDLIVRRTSNLIWRSGWRNRALSFDTFGDRLTQRMKRAPAPDFRPIYGFMGKATKNLIEAA